MFFTFYSYKGGVGRSMALAAVAYVFARRGLRVLAIDFDMEAPGLERYFFDGERSRTVREQRGLMDLIKAYRLALSNKAAFEEAEFKRLERFKINAIGNVAPPRGSVDLMTAGQREPEENLRRYALDVRGFDWQDFFQNWKGNLFFDWLRRRLGAPEDGYDVVLVDSRTGVTEMGGVCAYQLADVAVLLCAPNYQNLEGTRDVARDFRSDAVLALRQGRPLEILAVPARLEETHPSRAEFLAGFQREMGIDGLPKVLAEAGLSYEKLALPYLPQFAVVERLVGESASGTGLDKGPVLAFERLAAALCLLAPPDSALGAQRSWALAQLRAQEVMEGPTLVADPTQSSAGFDVYLDVAPGDQPLGRDLAQALEAEGLKVFVGSGPDDVSLEYSHALVTCFGTPTDDENRAQLLARARKLRPLRIVPVVLPGGSSTALASFDLSLSQAVCFGTWPDVVALQALASALRAPVPFTPERPAFRTEGRPYPGAPAYREDESEWFAGRDAEVQEVIEGLCAHDLVVVRGPAQVGKTSLLAAGVLPALRSPEAPAPVRGRKLHWCEGAELGRSGEPAAWLGARDEPGLLVVDHADSFDADGSPEAVAQRMQAIAATLRLARASGCKAILCWRGVLPEQDRQVALAGAAFHSVVVDVQPLSGPALRQAIEEPARRCGHLLEPGLTERLIESAGAADNAIAQIQRALAVLWPERRRGWLTNKCLDAVGHLGGLFERHLAQVRSQLSPQHAAAAGVLFKHLVLVNPQLRLVSAPRHWDDLAQVPDLAPIDALALRDRLASAGLIDLRLESTPAGEQVRLALVRQNPAVYVGGQEVDDLPFLVWRSELWTALQRWRNGAEADDLLLRGSALAEAQEWIEKRRHELTGLESRFIDGSVQSEQQRRDALERERGERLKAAEERAEAERRVNARLRRGRFALSFLALASLGFGFWALDSMNAAQREREEAQLKDTAVDNALGENARLAQRNLRAASEIQDVVARLSATQATARTDGETLGYAIEQLRGATQQLQKASVQMAPRVYLHISQEGQREAAQAFGQQLARLRHADGPIIVPGTCKGDSSDCPARVELVQHSAQGVLRCFRAKECSDEAPGLLALANGLLVSPKLQIQDLSARYETSTSIRPHHFEVWFGQQEIRLASPK